MIVTRSGYFNENLSYFSSVPTMSSIQKEYNSRINKKRKEGYKSLHDFNIGSPDNLVVNFALLDSFLPITNLDNNWNLKPMKCQTFVAGKIKYPRIGQPKYNGIRGTIRLETFDNDPNSLFSKKETRAVIRSMEGMEYVVPNVLHDANTIFKWFSTIALDGELYIHGYRLNEINSSIPKIINGKLSNCSRANLTPKLVFKAFDLSIENEAQLARLEYLDTICKIGGANVYNYIEASDYKIVYSDAEAYVYAKECIANGYEGAVFRDIEAEYRFGSRPSTIHKLKFFQDGEFEILDVVPKHATPQLGMFVCRNDINDHTFEVNPMGDTTYQKSILINKDKYIGKMATVKYYERSGVKDVPFHANALIIRDYE